MAQGSTYSHKTESVACIFLIGENELFESFLCLERSDCSTVSKYRGNTTDRHFPFVDICQTQGQIIQGVKYIGFQ